MLADVTIDVDVMMPAAASYSGKRFGTGDTYAASETDVSIAATSVLSLHETLKSGDAVQYILSH